MFGAKSLRSYWKKHVRKDLAYLQELAEKDNLRDVPEVSLHTAAEGELINAIDVLAGTEDVELAAKFLNRAVALADRQFSEDRFDAPGSDLRFPYNRAIAARTRAYARALGGAPLDTGSLLSASEDFEVFARKYDDPRDPYQNNEQTRYYWIDGVHTALIAGDSGRAEHLMAEMPRPVKYNKRHAELLSRLVNATGGPGKAESDRLADDFNAFFDDARDPRRRHPTIDYLPSTVGPLELAILRELYVHQPDQPLDWGDVIGAYAG